MNRLVLAVLALLSIACGGGQGLVSDPTPVFASQKEAFMYSEMKRFEVVLNMGEFRVTFGDPPAAWYAGWAHCNPSGRAPWDIGFNKGYIATLADDNKSYMSALVAHEMCHHWVQHRGGGSCRDEEAAELCAFKLTTGGSL